MADASVSPDRAILRSTSVNMMPSVEFDLLNSTCSKSPTDFRSFLISAFRLLSSTLLSMRSMNSFTAFMHSLSALNDWFTPLVSENSASTFMMSIAPAEFSDSSSMMFRLSRRSSSTSSRPL